MKRLIQVGVGMLLLAVSTTARAEELTEKAEPHFRAEVIGLTEDRFGSQIKVRLHEPEGQRVTKLRGFFRYHGPEGERLDDLPMTSFGFPPHPFDHEPSRLLTDRLREDAAELRRMAEEQPEKITASFVPTAIEFDEDLANEPRRIVSKTVSDAGVTKLTYTVQNNEVVFAGLVTHRWDRSWVRPLFGLVFPENTVEADVKFTVEVRPPKATNDGRWRWWVGYADAVSHGSYGGSIAAEPGEEVLSIRDIEVPLLLGGAEVRLIPYRMVDGRTDSLLVIFADDRASIEGLVKPLPQKRDFDWEQRFFPVRLLSTTSVDDADHE